MDVVRGRAGTHAALDCKGRGGSLFGLKMEQDLVTLHLCGVVKPYISWEDATYLSGRFLIRVAIHVLRNVITLGQII